MPHPEPITRRWARRAQRGPRGFRRIGRRPAATAARPPLFTVKHQTGRRPDAFWPARTAGATREAIATGLTLALS